MGNQKSDKLVALFSSRVDVSSSWSFYVLKELHPTIFLSKNSVNKEVSLYN